MTDPDTLGADVTAIADAAERSAHGSRRPRARKGEGSRLRTEILGATEKLLLREGSSEAVSIRMVADAVGVTAPSIYRHFPDKDSLIYEVCNRHFIVLDAEIEAAVAGVDDPVEDLSARGRAYLEFGIANPEPYRVMFMTRPEVAPVERQQMWLKESTTFLGLVDSVQRCIDAGRLRTGFDDAFRISVAMWARVHGLTSLIVSKPFLFPEASADRQAFLDDYMDTCLYGIVAG
jgi:AcrR family transcriptional regulator